MKTNPILTAIVLTTTLFTKAAIAQAASPATSEPPVAPAAPEAAPAIVVNPTPTPSQIIYLPQLPSATALANAAASQGIGVEQINQTSTQITVVYKYSNGQTNAICYQLLSAAAAAPVPAGATTVPVPAQATVIYERPAPVYYYDPFYYPWPYFAPFSVSLGFGFHGGYYGGYYGGYHRGGGFHGGYHGRR
jgi:hypothetical protein